MAKLSKMDGPACNFASLQELAQPLGLALLGVAPAEPTQHRHFIEDWLANAAHGEMAYLATHLAERLDPRVLVPGAKSVICVADVHAQRANHEEQDSVSPDSPIAASERATGRIARYAWGDDYHKVIKRRLFTLADALRQRFAQEAFKVAVDTAPVLERQHAMRAGLGWTGKHTLLIHPQLGSYLLLGEIITTLAIETSQDAGYPGPLVSPVDHCGTCTRCIDACPTDCIEPYQLDASRCISYLTLEHRSPIPTTLHAPMGDWIAGCDICQEVCPYNRPTNPPGRLRLSATSQPTVRPEYAPRPPAPALPLLDVLNWSATDRQQAFTRSALKRIKLEMLKRNALIAAGNHLRRHTDPALHQRIEQLAADDTEPTLVRDTAQQVLDALKRPQPLNPNP